MAPAVDGASRAGTGAGGHAGGPVGGVKKSLADLMEESAMEAEAAGGHGSGDRFTVQAADDRPWH